MTSPKDVIARLDGKDVKAMDANILIHKVTEALFAHRLVTVDGRMYRRIQNEFQYRDTDAQQCVPWNNVELVSIFDLLLDGGFHDVVLEADYPLGGRQAFGLLFECRANVIECRNLKYGIPTPCHFQFVLGVGGCTPATAGRYCLPRYWHCSWFFQ